MKERESSKKVKEIREKLGKLLENNRKDLFEILQYIRYRMY
jgi:hypothetical protein